MSPNVSAHRTAVRVGLFVQVVSAGGVLWILTVVVGLSAGPGLLRTSVSNLSAVAFWLVLAVGSFRRERVDAGAPEPQRASWLLGGWAGVLGAVSGLAYAAIPLLTGPGASPVTVLARATSIAPPLLVAAALMVATPPEGDRSKPLASAFDATIFAGASYLLLWLVGFRDVASALQPGLDTLAVLTPFVGSALALGVVAYHWSDAELPFLAPVTMVATWAALGLLSESAFAMTYAQGRWQAGHPIELFGMIRMIPLAAAPFAPLVARARRSPRTVPGDVLIYAPTGAALVASVVRGADGTLVYDAVTVSLFLLVGFAILVRQFLALQTVRTLSRTLERRVEERTEELLEARRAAERGQRLEAIGRLAGGVAHDFNNLLAAIAGHAGLLREDLEAGDPSQEDVDAIEKAAERGAALTRQLLTFARREPGDVRAIPLPPLVEETVRFLRRVAPAGIALDVSVEGTIPSVRMDPAHVDQLVTNLVVNARQAVGAAGHIRVSLAAVTVDPEGAATYEVRPGPFVRLTVSDDGVGIPEEIVDRIFEPFFTTRPKGEGTGLGLATCYGIVSGAEGFLTVDSAPGRGSSFHCWLPAAPEASPDEARP